MRGQRTLVFGRAYEPTHLLLLRISLTSSTVSLRPVVMPPRGAPPGENFNFIRSASSVAADRAASGEVGILKALSAFGALPLESKDLGLKFPFAGP